MSLPWPSPVVGALCAPRLRATPSGASVSRTLSYSLDLLSLRPRALYPHPIPATYDCACIYVHPAVCISLLFFGLGRLSPLLHLYSRAAARRSAQLGVRVKSVVNSCRLVSGSRPDDSAPSGRSWGDSRGCTAAWASTQCWSISGSSSCIEEGFDTYSNQGPRRVFPVRRPSFSAAPFEDFRGTNIAVSNML